MCRTRRWALLTLLGCLVAGCSGVGDEPAPTSAGPPISTPAVRPVDVAYQTVGTGDRILVLVHGGPGTPAPEYLTQFAPLVQNGIRLVYYDQRGVGASPDPDPVDPRGWSPDAYVADLERLRQRLGVEKINLLGHSWGGELVSLYTAAHPDRVERLVDLDGSPVALQARAEFKSNVNSRIADLKRQGVVPSVMPPMADCVAYWKAIVPVYAGGADRAARYAPTYVPDSSDHCAREATAQLGSDLAQTAEQPQLSELLTQLKNWPGRVLIMQGVDDPLASLFHEVG